MRVSPPSIPGTVKLHPDEWAVLRRIATQRGTSRHSLMVSALRQIIAEQYVVYQKTPTA